MLATGGSHNIFDIRKKKLRGHVARLRAQAALCGERANVIRRTCCVHTRGSDVSRFHAERRVRKQLGYPPTRERKKLRGHVCSYCVE